MLALVPVLLMLRLVEDNLHEPPVFALEETRKKNRGEGREKEKGSQNGDTVRHHGKGKRQGSCRSYGNRGVPSSGVCEETVETEEFSQKKEMENPGVDREYRNPKLKGKQQQPLDKMRILCLSAIVAGAAAYWYVGCVYAFGGVLETEGGRTGKAGQILRGNTR